MGRPPSITQSHHARWREAINLTQAQMAPLVGMRLSGYRKWEQGARRVSGPAPALLQVGREGAYRP